MLRGVEPVETRGRQDRCVHLPFIDFLEARRDVAAQFHDLEIRVHRQKLRPAAQARRPDS